MTNLEIRQAIFAKGLKHWQIAKAMNVSEGTFSRWMRYEMDEDRKKDVMKVIKKLR